VAADTPAPWLAGEAPSLGDARRHAPATLRNRDAIADVLRAELPASGTVLEVASGSGEHIVHFAGLFSVLLWQPSDPDPAALTSIAAWAKEHPQSNLRPPLMLDAAAPDWPVTQADAVLCINMVHISPWAATLGLLRSAAQLLPAGAPLILYGPFIQAGVETAPSNLAFDASLRARDPAWGLRAVEDVADTAAREGLRLAAIHSMPANNLAVVLRRG
jgi:hypothetical protein